MSAFRMWEPVAVTTYLNIPVFSMAKCTTEIMVLTDTVV